MKKLIKFFCLTVGIIMLVCSAFHNLDACNVRALNDSFVYVNDAVDLDRAIRKKESYIYLSRDIHLKNPLKIDYPVVIELGYFKIYTDDDFIDGKKSVIIIDGKRICKTSDLPLVIFRNGVIYNKNMGQSIEGYEGEDGMDTIHVSFAKVRFDNCSIYGGNGQSGGDGSLARKNFWGWNKNGRNGRNGGDGGAAVVLNERAIVELYNSWLFGGNGGNGGNGGDSKIETYGGNGAVGGDGGSAVVINGGFLNIIQCIGVGTKLQAGNGGAGGNKGHSEISSYWWGGKDGVGGDGGDAVWISRRTYSKIEGVCFATLVPGAGGVSNVSYGENGIAVRNI